MDSNETSKNNKALDDSNEMELSDSNNTQDKEKEETTENMDFEEVTNEVIESSENTDSAEKTETEKIVETEMENHAEPEKSNNNHQSNITPEDSETAEKEKSNENEDSAAATEDSAKAEDPATTENLVTANDVKEAEPCAMDTVVSPEPPASPKDRKRKHRSMTRETASGEKSPEPAAVEQNGSDVNASGVKRKKLDKASNSDNFCWRCHKESVEAQCSACPRSWHRRCMGGAPPLCVNNWICVECANILQAENVETRSPAMGDITVDQLCMMLRYVVERMREQTGSQPFMKAVDTKEVPNYLDFIIKPMDLSLLESNVRAKLYGSTEAFMADAKWIQHNCIIFNTYTSKLTNTAKQMLKVARQEVAEIESCPDCFAHGRNLPRHKPSWFIEPCRRPHAIVWAKLKGFPFWPAKALPKLNTQGLVDVRFFGEHDRAWVSAKDIYLYSQESPALLPKKKKFEMEQCMQEVEDHVARLKDTFGEFRYAPPKVPYDPHDPMQIQTLLPTYDPSKYIRADAFQRTEAQSPAVVSNKAESPKVVEKKPQNQKNAAEVTSTNGVKESPVSDNSKLARNKKKALTSPDESVNMLSDEVEIIDSVDRKRKSKSPAVAASNNNNSDAVSDKSRKNDIVDTSNTPTKAAAVPPVKKFKSIAVRRLTASELTKDMLKKASVSVVKSANGKTATVINVPSDLNKLDGEETKTTSPGQKPKTLYIQSNSKKFIPINHRVVMKHSQTLGGKVVVAARKSMGAVPDKSLEAINQRKLINQMANSMNESLNNSSQIAVRKKPLIIARKSTTSRPITIENQEKMVRQMAKSIASDFTKQPNHKDSPVTIKQEPKDDDQPKLTITRKPSKARKSFPNRLSDSSPSKTANSTSSPSAHEKSKPGTSGTGDASDEARSTRTSFELPPAEAGPATAKIHESSKDLASRVAQLITDTIKEAAENNGAGGNSLINHHEATIHYLKLRMERMKWEHQQEINELKHNNDLVIRELKASMEVERYRALQDARRESEIDKLRSIEETKRKQWCVVCGREAMFYCCWNTAYCDYPCQQKHWSSHIGNCAQKSQLHQSQSTSSSSSQNDSPAPPQKSAAANNNKSPQVMPKLVINKPKQSASSMRRA